jgi:hypothetical protein
MLLELSVKGTAVDLKDLNREVTSDDWLRKAALAAQAVSAELSTEGIEIPKYLKKGDFESVALILEAAVKKYGVWNVLAIFPDLLRTIGMNQREENSERDRDYDFAADVVESFLPAVDLSYGERSTPRGRREALGTARDMIAKLDAR